MSTAQSSRGKRSHVVVDNWPSYGTSLDKNTITSLAKSIALYDTADPKIDQVRALYTGTDGYVMTFMADAIYGGSVTCYYTSGTSDIHYAIITRDTLVSTSDIDDNEVVATYPFNHNNGGYPFYFNNMAFPLLNDQPNKPLKLYLSSDPLNYTPISGQGGPPNGKAYVTVFVQNRL